MYVVVGVDSYNPLGAISEGIGFTDNHCVIYSDKFKNPEANVTLLTVQHST